MTRPDLKTYEIFCESFLSFSSGIRVTGLRKVDVATDLVSLLVMDVVLRLGFAINLVTIHHGFTIDLASRFVMVSQLIWCLASSWFRDPFNVTLDF